MPKPIFLYGIENTDFPALTAMLATSYWVPDITETEIRRAAQNSAVIANVYSESQQIGFCRAVSDKTRFAYIMDVFIHQDFRRQGIGQQLLRFILAHPDLASVYHFCLLTRDAHKFYEKVGFSPFSRPADLLEIKIERSSMRSEP